MCVHDGNVGADERNWPTYKGNAQQSNVEPNATIYIVTGSAGCQEMHEPFTRPMPARSAFRTNVRALPDSGGRILWGVAGFELGLIYLSLVYLPMGVPSCCAEAPYSLVLTLVC